MHVNWPRALFCLLFGIALTFIFYLFNSFIVRPTWTTPERLLGYFLVSFPMVVFASLLQRRYLPVERQQRSDPGERPPH